MKFPDFSQYLPPRLVIHLDRERAPTQFELKRRLDGRLRLTPAHMPGAPRYLLVIDASVPFRRRLATQPATRAAKSALLRSAHAYFASVIGEARYCLGRFEGQPYIFALPLSLLDELVLACGRNPGDLPAAVLVADADGGADAVFRAVEAWQDDGRLVDLSAAPRTPWPYARVVSAVSGAAVLALAGLTGTVLWLERPTLDKLEAKVAEAETSYGELSRRQEVTANMVAAMSALDGMQNAPSVAAMRRLEAVLARLPSRHTIATVEIKRDSMRISGQGGVDSDWLTASGFPAEGIVVTRLPQGERYSAEIHAAANAKPK